MKNLLKLEEAAQFLGCAFALYLIGVPWWVYLLLLLGPDISMLGYLVGTRTGAFTYDLFHHKGVALLCVALAFMHGYDRHPTEGLLQEGSASLLTGLILYGHPSMDRVLGYGLKFGDSFKHTHLGWIGVK